ncbi:hypothetical protein EB093_08665 [bacterium]|nr:hypothetical protein [bacterium]
MGNYGATHYGDGGGLELLADVGALLPKGSSVIQLFNSDINCWLGQPGPAGDDEMAANQFADVPYQKSDKMPLRFRSSYVQESIQVSNKDQAVQVVNQPRRIDVTVAPPTDTTRNLLGVDYRVHSVPDDGDCWYAATVATLTSEQRDGLGLDTGDPVRSLRTLTTEYMREKFNEGSIPFFQDMLVSSIVDRFGEEGDREILMPAMPRSALLAKQVEFLTLLEQLDVKIDDVDGGLALISSLSSATVDPSGLDRVANASKCQLLIQDIRAESRNAAWPTPQDREPDKIVDLNVQLVSAIQSEIGQFFNAYADSRMYAEAPEQWATHRFLMDNGITPTPRIVGQELLVATEEITRSEATGHYNAFDQQALQGDPPPVAIYLEGKHFSPLSRDDSWFDQKI